MCVLSCPVRHTRVRPLQAAAGRCRLRVCSQQLGAFYYLLEQRVFEQRVFGQEEAKRHVHVYVRRPLLAARMGGPSRWRHSERTRVRAL